MDSDLRGHMLDLHPNVSLPRGEAELVAAHKAQHVWYVTNHDHGDEREWITGAGVVMRKKTPDG